MSRAGSCFAPQSGRPASVRVTPHLDDQQKHALPLRLAKRRGGRPGDPRRPLQSPYAAEFSRGSRPALAFNPVQILPQGPYRSGALSRRLPSATGMWRARTGSTSVGKAGGLITPRISAARAAGPYRSSPSSRAMGDHRRSDPGSSSPMASIRLTGIGLPAMSNPQRTIQPITKRYVAYTVNFPVLREPSVKVCIDCVRAFRKHQASPRAIGRAACHECRTRA